MNKDEKFHLDNPPIKEVSLALFINSDSYNTAFINKVKNEIKQDYPLESLSRAIQIDFNKDNQIEISNQDSSGYILGNTDRTELWNIDLQKILYSDKSKYLDFDSYLTKFSKYFNIIKNNFKNNFSYSNIVLKYSNEFDFPIDSLQEHFAILPLFQQEYQNITYAANTSCVVINNIINNENKNMSAGVVAAFSVFEQIPTKFRINFDIEVRYNFKDNLQNNCMYNQEVFSERLNEIRNFKNKIFFANVKNAKGDFSK